MNYRLIRSVKNKTAGAKFLAPITVVLAVALFYFYYPSFLQSVAQSVGAPFLRFRAFSLNAVSDAFLYFKSTNALILERNNLLKELEETKALFSDRDLLAEELKILKEKFGRSVSEKRIIAAVLSVPPRSPYDTLVLDVGKEDGVSLGDEVANGAIVIGVLKKVFLRTSIAELFSTAGNSTEVSILHNGISIPAEAVGQGGGMFKILLPKTVAVEVGDFVVIPRLTPVFLGVIEIAQGNATDSFQTLYFKSSLPAGRDLFVTVIPRVPYESI